MTTLELMPSYEEAMEFKQLLGTEHYSEADVVDFRKSVGMVAFDERPSLENGRLDLANMIDLKDYPITTSPELQRRMLRLLKF